MLMDIFIKGANNLACNGLYTHHMFNDWDISGLCGERGTVDTGMTQLDQVVRPAS